MLNPRHTAGKVQKSQKGNWKQLGGKDSSTNGHLRHHQQDEHEAWEDDAHIAQRKWLSIYNYSKQNYLPRKGVKYISIPPASLRASYGNLRNEFISEETAATSEGPSGTERHLRIPWSLPLFLSLASLCQLPGFIVWIKWTDSTRCLSPRSPEDLAKHWHLQHKSMVSPVREREIL